MLLMAVLVVMVVLTLLRFSLASLRSSAVVGGGLAFLSEGLRIWNKVEVAEALIALAGELD